MPEDVCVVGQRLYLTVGFGGLAGKFCRLFFVANLQVKLRLAFAGDAAGFTDLFLEGVLVFIGDRLIGEEFGHVLIDGLEAAVELVHRVDHGLVDVVVVFLFLTGLLLGLGSGLEFQFLEPGGDVVELGQDLGAFIRLAKRVVGGPDGGQALGLFLGDGGFLEVYGL